MTLDDYQKVVAKFKPKEGWIPVTQSADELARLITHHEMTDTKMDLFELADIIGNLLCSLANISNYYHVDLTDAMIYNVSKIVHTQGDKDETNAV